MNKFIIYGLMDPFSQQLRYVGKSVSGLARPKAHWNPSSLKERTKKAAWVKSVLAKQGIPEIVVLDEADSAFDLIPLEMFWIRYFRSIGEKLTNMTDGGDGCTGRQHSEETKQQIGKSQIGKVIPPEHRRKIALARGVTPEMSAGLLADYLEGTLSGPAIAKKYGVSKRLVYLIAERTGVWRPSLQRRLSDQAKGWIRLLRGQGLSCNKIAPLVGFHVTCVCRWVNKSNL
jgi:hypothetical protein